jgi:SNF2 family DNA or RNA helicase
MTVDMAIKKVTKLRQLTGGWMLGDDGKPVMVGHEKLEELLSLLDECQGQKVLIWCQFVHEIEQLCRYIPGAKAYYGKTSEKEREAARKDFDTLILQNDTGSMGLTLNEATVSIFYSNPSYPLPKEQARDRNHRKGQGQPVSEYELIVTGSIDESIFNSIINRKSLADAMVNAVNDPSQFREVLLPKRRVSWKAEDKTSNIVLPAGSH